MGNAQIEDLLGATQVLTKYSKQGLWVDYDKEVDVLYISFFKPQNATHSEMLEDGVIIDYRDDEMVGVTVLDASSRRGLTQSVR